MQELVPDIRMPLNFLAPDCTWGESGVPETFCVKLSTRQLITEDLFL